MEATPQVILCMLWGNMVMHEEGSTSASHNSVAEGLVAGGNNLLAFLALLAFPLNPLGTCFRKSYGMFPKSRQCMFPKSRQ